MTSMKIEKRILKWRNPQQHNSTQLKLSEIIIEKPLEKDSGEGTRDYWCAVEVA